MPYDSLDERKPLDMGATATRNLGIRDAGDAKVNAVRSNLVMPATGSLGSTAQTQTANISMARAMERADRGNRFGFGSQEYLQNTDTPVRAPQVDPVIGQLRSRQQQLLQGIDPDKPAIYPNSKRQAEMRQELYHVTGILHEQTLADAHDAHENYRQQRDIQSAEEFSGLVNGLAGMKTKPGTPEHRAELLGLIQQFPVGAQTGAARELIRQHANTHDTATNAIGLSDQPADQYYDPQTLLRDNPGAEYRQDPKTGGYYVYIGGKQQAPEKPNSNAMRDLAKMNAQLADKMSYLEKEKEPAAKNELQKAITSIESQIGAWHETYGLPLKKQPARAAPPISDLKALAQKALDDPNASEAHKAAARKLLGK